ncbi:MAG: reverse gyrase [Desulfurococcaceae archaeon]
MSTIVPIYEDTLHGHQHGLAKADVIPHVEALRSSEREFEAFFEKATCGFKPWGAQRTWLKRLLQGDNVVLTAPTGLGKTTLLVVYALYAAGRGKKILYIAPTRPLQEQTYNRMLSYLRNLELGNVRIVYYSSNMGAKKRYEVLEQVSACDFDILVVTSNFVLKRFDSLSRCHVDVIIVDDVDSLIKSEKSVYSLLKLLGYTEKAIELAKKRVNLLWKILAGKALGKPIEELVKEYVSIDIELEKELSSISRRQLIVASATGRARGSAGRLLRDLLRIDVAGIAIYGRDVTDSYLLVADPREMAQQVSSLIFKIGKGCIIYISPHHPLREDINRVVELVASELEKRGFSVGRAGAKDVAKFVDGRLDVLIGTAAYYGSSVRGIDAPKHARYAIFLGVPLISIPLEAFLANMNFMARTLLELYSKTGNHGFRDAAVKIRKKSLELTPAEKRLLKYCLIGKIPQEALAGSQKLMSILSEVREVYNVVLSSTKALLDQHGVFNVGTITLVRDFSGRYVALVPDVMTYIQASGRVSRFLGNRMTHGLAIIVEFKALSNLVKSLEARMRWFAKEFSITELDRVDLDAEISMIQESRNNESRRGLNHKSVLVVVESPTKAKTIARFFGKPTSRKIGGVKVYSIPAKIGEEVVEFNIVATRGHIYDLTTADKGLYGVYFNQGSINPVYVTLKKCRICGAQFTDLDTCPRCGSRFYFDSKAIISVLQKLALEVDEVYVATDPDIEGEKIAYDVYNCISALNGRVKRVELHEITLSEFLKGINRARDLDLRLVEAEIYRRVLDRLIGFSLSKKLQLVYGKKYLGAGRVQTPVLGLIIDRYREYLANRCRKVIIEIGGPLELSISACIEESNKGLLDVLRGAKQVVFFKESEMVEQISPKPPYTTDEILFDASRKGFGAAEAMRILQELFEAGLITYHRTDCTYVSDAGISVAREYLGTKGYLRLFKPSHWGEPGSHEAIRPVYPLDSEDLLKAIDEGVLDVAIPITSKHLKLYDMIFKRFIASQMRSFKALRAIYRVLVSNIEIAKVSLYLNILEEGFNVITNVKTYPQIADLDTFTAAIRSLTLKNSSKTPLYREGDVVMLMKKYGIGRPSTYAKTIETIKRHGYVVESRILKKLVPTKRGIAVYEFLKTNYPELVSIELTRKMETTIDLIVSGKITGYDALLELLAEIKAIGLLGEELPSLNLYQYIGPYSTFYRATAN